jgi:peptidyl-prolyl cis-trans isomerase A (cyclophilin A)
MLKALLPLILLLATGAVAQDVAPPPPVPVPVVPPLPMVGLATSEGLITITLESRKAPLTSANFLRYVDQKRLDGTGFYRAMSFPRDPPIGLIQGGIRNEAKRILPPIAHESTAKTGLTHDDMAISMARGAPGSAAGDFFIIVGGLPSLDAQPPGGGDTQGYAVFGHVTGGQDIVRRIMAAPTSPTAGEGAMKGQMIAAPIRILTARRVKPAPVVATPPAPAVPQ